VQQALRGTVWSSGCASYYRQSDGRIFSIWPWSTWRYWLSTRRVNASSYNFVRIGQDAAAGLPPQRAAA